MVAWVQQRSIVCVCSMLVSNGVNGVILNTLSFWVATLEHFHCVAGIKIVFLTLVASFPMKSIKNERSTRTNWDCNRTNFDKWLGVNAIFRSLSRFPTRSFLSQQHSTSVYIIHFETKNSVVFQVFNQKLFPISCQLIWKFLPFFFVSFFFSSHFQFLWQ